jgi:hypothetical protein
VKNLLVFLTPLSVFIFLSSGQTVSAQNKQLEPLCYWKNSNNLVIDLGLLCGVQPVKKATPQIPKNTGIPRKTVNKTVNRFTDKQMVDGLIGTYGISYCEAMEAGGRTRTEAKEGATKKITDLLFTFYDVETAGKFVDQNINTSFFQRVEEFVKVKCPKYQNQF